MAPRLQLLAFVALPLSLVLASPALDIRASCNGDNCLRQLRGGPSSLSATAYCSSLLDVPVSTVTAPTSTVTVSTTVTSTSTLAITLPSYPDKKRRDAAPEPTGFEKREKIAVRAPEPSAALDLRQVALPPYASACTSTGTTTSRIQSACSCLVIPTSTTTVTPIATTNIGPTATVTVCPGTIAQIVPLTGFSISNDENMNGGSELSVYNTDDPAVCCGACFTMLNCQSYMIEQGQCVLQSAYGPNVGDNPSCPAGLGTAFDISYGNPGYAGFGSCLSIE